MDARIAVLPGDGVGPEVVAQAVKVIRAAGRRFGHSLDLVEGRVGFDAYRDVGNSCPDETIELCESSDAILFGSTGAPPEEPRPPMGSGGQRLRQHFKASCNFRPVKLLAPLAGVGPIRPEAKAGGVDFVIARDIAAKGAYGPGGLRREGDQRLATSTFTYTESEVERVVRPAYELARSRRKRIHLVGYWDIIGCSDIWRVVFDEVGAEYPDVERRYMLPDHCNMLVARDASEFDVVLFDDLFRAGMVVDLAAMLAGSLGMVPSAMMRPHVDEAGRPLGSLERVFGMYEPSHGSVPGRAGKDQVNPIATILSAALLLRYSLGQAEEADAIERSITKVLADGFRTYDLMEQGTTLVTCSEMGDRVAAQVENETHEARSLT